MRYGLIESEQGDLTVWTGDFYGQRIGYLLPGDGGFTFHGDSWCVGTLGMEFKVDCTREELAEAVNAALIALED